MKYWRNQGAPVDKLVVGFPTYGRTFRTLAANGLGAPASGPASAGPYTREAGFWSYYEVCEGSTLRHKLLHCRFNLYNHEDEDV